MRKLAKNGCRFTIHGTRGSIPASGREFLRHGGHTTCFSLETSRGMIIVDAGTGILSLSRQLMRRRRFPDTVLLFTHFHMDHLIGLAGFEPFYRDGMRVQIFADSRRAEDWKAALRTFVGKPFWPVGVEEFPARIEMSDLPTGGKGMEVYGVKISWCQVPHPQQSLAYRLEMPRKTIVIATDIEMENPDINPAFLNLCRNADTLIYDAQYTVSEYKSRKGWGHGTWQHGVEIVKRTDVKQLVLTHHDPYRSDRQIDRIIEAARKSFPACRAATENMVLV